MGRGVDVVKHQKWRSRLQRFSQLGLTVAEFCHWEGVSVATFYNWRRKCDANPEGRERETKVTDPPQFAKTPFLPVRLTSAGTSRSTPTLTEWSVSTSARMEILLPNGVRILVSASDMTTMQQAIMAAGRILPVTEIAAC